MRPARRTRVCGWIGAAALVAAMAGGTVGQRVAIVSVHMYQRHVAPMAGHLGLRCRLTPSCSHYGEIALARDGLVRGGWQTLRRIARCGPWTPIGTHDEP